MKKWTRYLCLLLSLVMCLTLAACASKEDKAFDEANALLESGDYEGAIAAFSAIGRYQEISAKIAEATQLLDESNAGFLYGTWMDMNSSIVFDFFPERAATLSSSEEVTTLAYSYADGVVTVTQPVVMNFNVTEMDGITHLVCNGMYDLVSEADYAVIGPQPVEITMDNWAEYFELREAKNVYFNEFGDLDYSQPGYGIFLKDAYYDRLAHSYEAAQVNFEMTYDEACFTVVDYDPDTFDSNLLGEYTLVPATGPSWYGPMQTGMTTTGSVSDNRNYEYGTPEQNPYYLKVAAMLPVYGSSGSDNSTYYYWGAANAQVTRVQGTLMLLPE